MMMDYLPFNDVVEMFKNAEYTDIVRTGRNHYTAVNTNGIKHGFDVNLNQIPGYKYCIMPDDETCKELDKVDKKHVQQLMAEFIDHETNEKTVFTDFVIDADFHFKKVKPTEPTVTYDVIRKKMV